MILKRLQGEFASMTKVIRSSKTLWAAAVGAGTLPMLACTFLLHEPTGSCPCNDANEQMGCNPAQSGPGCVIMKWQFLYIPTRNACDTNSTGNTGCDWVRVYGQKQEKACGPNCSSYNYGDPVNCKNSECTTKVPSGPACP